MRKGHRLKFVWQIIFAILVVAALAYISWNTYSLAKSKKISQTSSQNQEYSPSIKLPASVKSSDAVDAILAYNQNPVSSALPSNQKNIIDQINGETLQLNGQPFTRNASSAGSEQGTNNDSITSIKDSNGNSLELQIAKKLYEMSGGHPAIATNVGSGLVNNAIAASASVPPTTDLIYNDPDHPCEDSFRVSYMSDGKPVSFVMDVSDELDFVGTLYPSNPADRNVFCSAYVNVTQHFGLRSDYYITDQATAKKYAKIHISMYTVPAALRSACHAKPDDDVFACYDPDLNTINYQDETNQEDFKEVIDHEMTHAFHGLFVFGSYGIPTFWEEGFAETDAQTIVGWDRNDNEEIGMNDLDGGGNMPYGDFSSYYGLAEGNPSQPYYLGTGLFWKFYLENNNFFRMFNDQYYSLAVAFQGTNNSIEFDNLMNIAAEVIPKVEGISTGEWFAEHPITVSRTLTGDQSEKIAYCDTFYITPTQNLLKITKSKKSGVNSLKVDLYDDDSQLLGTSSVVVTDENPYSINLNAGFIKADKLDYYSGYEGLLKVMITVNGNNNDQRTKYIYKSSHYADIAGVTPGGSDSITIKSLSSGKSWTMKPVDNDFFYFADPELRGAGKFILTASKLVYLSYNGKTIEKNEIYSKQIDKGINPDKTLFAVLQTTQTNLCFGPSCAGYRETVSIGDSINDGFPNPNHIPFARFWGDPLDIRTNSFYNAGYYMDAQPGWGPVKSLTNGS